jgi:replicative DNA helicase
MSDVSAIVLHKLLAERSIEVWSKLKLTFLDAAYTSLYSSISKHYEKYGEIPSFEELDLVVREGSGKNTLAAVKLVSAPDISAEVAVDALMDQYTQNQTILLLEKFVDKIPVYDTAEIKDNLANIVLHLDEKTLTTEGVYTMADILLFRDEEKLAIERVHLGINNTFDAVLGGCARQELIMIGGQRGSGKSIISSNIVCNQYEAGNTAVYFSIEMIAHETLERKLAMLSDVPYMMLKQNTLLPSDVLKVVKTRAAMFEDADDLVMQYLDHRDKFKFEAELVKTKKLKQDNQMIIIDDRALTLSSIDLHLGKLKSKFGNKLTVAVVDYVNQIVVEGMDQFEWKTQVVVSKRLKELARKHEVVMVTPYQIDATGEARFAKGLLDAADIAMTLKAHEGAISFNTTKIRGGPSMQFASPINWSTLKLSSDAIDPPKSEEKEKKPRIKNAAHKTEEQAGDIPW